MTGDDMSRAGKSTRIELERIRREYPRAGFLVVEGRWIAVRGRRTLVEASMRLSQPGTRFRCCQ